MIGNKRSHLKKSVMNSIPFNEQLFDIDTIDVSSQVEKAEEAFTQNEKDIFRTYRLNCFSPKNEVNN